ncbi:hypothetical protein J4466_03905 [Candidatus Pacearchaeota archaeon]|nr:hypothetical protein [Candidatus Pacearchaeota archaeon]
MEKRQTKFRADIHKKLKKYIRRKKGRPFLFGQMKKQLFDATWYGGRAFKNRVKAVFHLNEFKEKGKVMLQKESAETPEKEDE